MKTKASTGISRLLPLLLLIFLNLLATAQDKTFNFFGKVIDEKTQFPLGGANVQIKGAYHQVIADNDGNFIVTAEQKFPFVLVVDYVGYESKEVTVTNAQKLIISLIETKNKQLNGSGGSGLRYSA
jgi:hypothetical protein